jgi:hypothetical protein
LIYRKEIGVPRAHFALSQVEEGQMHSKATQAQWPVIDNVIAPLAAWWRRRSIINENLADLDALNPTEMAHMAQDLGIAPGELRALARHSTDAADLLKKRLHALGLSRAELAKMPNAGLRDMERLCTLCRAKGRCAHDLATDPDDPVWHRYCPNEQTLTSLMR